MATQIEGSAKPVMADPFPRGDTRENIDGETDSPLSHHVQSRATLQQQLARLNGATNHQYMINESRECISTCTGLPHVLLPGAGDTAKQI